MVFPWNLPTVALIPLPPAQPSRQALERELSQLERLPKLGKGRSGQMDRYVSLHLSPQSKDRKR